jgi:hypothetical protein
VIEIPWQSRWMSTHQSNICITSRDIIIQTGLWTASHSRRWPLGKSSSCSLGASIGSLLYCSSTFELSRGWRLS